MDSSLDERNIKSVKDMPANVTAKNQVPRKCQSDDHTWILQYMKVVSVKLRKKS
jgi:hypothetical protein